MADKKDRTSQTSLYKMGNCATLVGQGKKCEKRKSEEHGEKTSGGVQNREKKRKKGFTGGKGSVKGTMNQGKSGTLGKGKDQ